MNYNERLPLEATQEIRYILENIRLGKFKHIQTEYHSECGTAHCVAGWKQVLDLQKKGIDYVELTKDAIWKRDEILSNALVPGLIQTPWRYASAQWGLSDREAAMLFDCNATLPSQFAVLEALELGRRLI